jgi:plastocyanin
VRRLVVALLVAALGATASAPVAASAAPAKPKYCKKKPSKLTKKQRKRCRKKRHATHSTTTTPTAPPITQPVTPPVVDPPATDPTPTTPALGRLGVTAKEFKLTLSRTTLTSGDALVQLQNAGEDPHDLHIEPAGGGALTADFPETDPRTQHQERVTFAPGTYKLYCSLPGHDGLGMHATLTVQ